MAKLKIAVLYGGKSPEHEVSIHSAAAVADILGAKYDITNIFISKSGNWFLQDSPRGYKEGDLSLTPVVAADHNLLCADGQKIKIEVFFPVLHGAGGEDGAMQGLFETLGAAYVGCGVLTSALGMDKELSKLLASFHGVPIVPYIKLTSEDKYKDEDLEAAVTKQLGYPLFVKPLSLGSSIGVSKVKDAKHLKGALAKAFDYEDAVLIEKGIDNAREVFCAVVGYGANIHTSLCGELKNASAGGFFDYQAKYEAAGGCDMQVPANLPQEVQDKMRIYAHDVFAALRGNGLARVDFLLGEDGKFYFSEINTMPGMSLSSLFPALWQSSSKTYESILDILVHLALRRHAARGAFKLDK